MTLTLKIDNYDVLDNGGPAQITLDQKGCQVGRRPEMDWVLPDPGRYVSGHHFDISYSDGDYWLTDVSSNGTFLQGEKYRLEGPRKLEHGDRFTIGHYIVIVDLSGGAGGAGGYAPVQTTDDSDPWSSVGVPLDPVNVMPAPPPQHLDDVASDFVPTPGFGTPPPYGAPPPGYPAQHGTPPQGYPPQGYPPQGYPPQHAPSDPYRQAQQPHPGAQPASQGGGGGGSFLDAFCQGAGLSPEQYAGADEARLAMMAGQSLRYAVQEIMAMLKDRAAVKEFTKGGERTVRVATGNNPMKFLPDTDQALEAMFLRPREGFMEGPEGIDTALSDLRRHQAAIFAALQPSLAALLRGLAPDDIEDDAGGGLLGGSNKSRAWDTFVERWDEKASAGDNGMLDAFLRDFAEAYRRATG